MRKSLLAVALVAGLVSVSVCAEEVEDFDRWYAGAAGGMFLPGNGTSLKRAGLVAVRGGWYATEFCAIEAEVLAAPNASSRGGHADIWGGSVQGLFHFAGWEEFDLLFGCERFDPFLTCGVQALCATRHVFADDSHRTGIGPSVGLGAFYHLTDRCSLRFDARAAMAVDSPCGMDYALTAGLQFGLGD